MWEFEEEKDYFELGWKMTVEGSYLFVVSEGISSIWILVEGGSEHCIWHEQNYGDRTL